MATFDVYITKASGEKILKDVTIAEVIERGAIVDGKDLKDLMLICKQEGFSMVAVPQDQSEAIQELFDKHAYQEKQKNSLKASLPKERILSPAAAWPFSSGTGNSEDHDSRE
jgi:hypothetical protein